MHKVRRLMLKARRRQVPLGERGAAEADREREEARARPEARIFNRC
jgi:hypothetical protein